jgi:CHAT domain-containing protein
MTRSFRPGGPWLLAAGLAFTAGLARAEPPAAVLISLGKGGRLEVSPLDADSQPRFADRAGLLVWTDEDGGERWQRVKKGWKMPEPGEKPAAELPPGGVTRGGGGAGSLTAATGLTRQLDPLRADARPRDVTAVITPTPSGRCLSRKPTFRRRPSNKGKPYPALAVPVSSADGKVKFSVGFKEGQDRLPFADLADLPRGMARDGLPPGSYRLPGPAGLTTFTVADEEERREVLAPVEELAKSIEDKNDPLYLQFTIEHLLGFKAEGNVPAPHLADALDVLESVPANSLPPYLAGQLAQLRLRLVKEDRASAPPPPLPTRIAAVDEALGLILAGQWDQAPPKLEAPAVKALASKDRRTRGLVALYRAVVLAEGGPEEDGKARQGFASALKDLEAGSPEDRYRAHFNAANFHQQQAENRLYNHAFQMATGARAPFLTLLADWQAARTHYESALAPADKLAGGAQARAGIQISQARLYALLADVLHTLGGFAEGESAATRQADKLAEGVAGDKAAISLDRALANEVRAQLAFRAGNLAGARAAAGRALADYVREGRLPAVENVYRLLGLADARDARTATGAKAEAARGAALRHLRIAHRISEALRARLPEDDTGASRAGFLARKAFVTDKIADLLLQSGQPAEALRYVELGKARALRDLLITRGEAIREAGDLAARLARWPRDAAALEYFLGPEQAWVFVIDTAGKVHAHPLEGAGGKPVAPRDLVARVQRFLRDTEGHSRKMLQRLLANKGFDHSWQDDLAELRAILVPAKALAELRKARVAVIVPQHVLHYFPFGALVTRKDPTRRAAKEMVKPDFLVEEKFTIVYSPSLATWRAQPVRRVRDVRAVGIVEVPGADPLPGVARDLKNLQSAFGSVTLLEGEKAKESVVKGLLGRPGVLFFATHGLNEADHPLDSHLLLMPEKADGGRGPPLPVADDGKLTAREIFGRKVQSDLVVLSACYSGLGDRSPLPGDDLFGLQRAFLASGARTVVSGLWDVYDETAPELMNGLFTRMARGEPAAAGLADAQRAFLAKQKASAKVEPYIHPYFWAVYTAAGDDRTRWGG